MQNTKNITEIQAQALANATRSSSISNYPAIFAGFELKGIPASDIKPRENIFTYHAWKAKGRVVKRGEHGVKIVSWVNMTRRDETTGETRTIGRKPRTATVFHVSQTEVIAR